MMENTNIKHKKGNPLRKILQAVPVILGAFITAYGLDAILIPNSVSDGGVTGLSIVCSQLTQVPLGILIVILNIPFVFLGYKQIGKTFTIYSVIGMASLAFGTSVMHHIPTIIEGRSEEHTSELQSRFDLVCRLLLEKKNE